MNFVNAQDDLIDEGFLRRLDPVGLLLLQLVDEGLL